MNKKKKNVDKEKQESGNEGGEENYYAIVPPNGGWGWVIVGCAFYCNVVVDGIQLTFGIFLKKISESINAEYSQVALVGSLMFGVHLLMGPLCAGLSHAFGLRPITILGSIICCFGMGMAYFATESWILWITYGFLGGVGLGLVYMNTLVIVSLYFTTLLPIAIAIVVSGTGLGTMVFAVLGSFLLRVSSWQISFLINAILAGSMAFAAMTFRPLKPIKVKVESKTQIKSQTSSKQYYEELQHRKNSFFIKTESVPTNSMKNLQSSTWNSVLEEMAVMEVRRKPCCTSKCSKCCRCCAPKEPSSEHYLILKKVSDDEGPPIKGKSYIEMGTTTRSGSTFKEVDEESDTSIRKDENAVSHHSIYKRVDVEEKHRGCDLIKKTISGMVNCRLLASCSFFLFTLSGAFQITALIIVYTFEKDRCTDLGFTEDMSYYFVLALGGANMFWRLLLGGLATIPKVNHVALSVTSTVIGGLATTFSNFFTDIYSQFVYCFLFGLAMASLAVFRVVMLVDLVENNQIANATGIGLLFMGVFSIIFPPLFGWVKQETDGYDLIFITTGVMLTVAGLMAIGLKRLRKKELEREFRSRRSPSLRPHHSK